MEVIKSMQKEHEQSLYNKLIEYYQTTFTIQYEEAKEVVEKNFHEWYPNV